LSTNKRSDFNVILAAMIVAMLAGFFAANYPDGLEKVAKILGFEKKAAIPPAVFIDYQLPMFPYPVLSSILAGVIGIIIIVFIFKSISNARHIGEFIRKLMKLGNP